MAVLFVVYMPNEDLESSDNDGPVSPAQLHLHQVANENGSKKMSCSNDASDDENEAVVSKISIDLGDDDEFSAKKPLLRNVHISSTSGNKQDKLDVDDKLVTSDQTIPRQSSDNTLTKLENTQSTEGVSDSVVYKGDRVRFQVTKLDTGDREGVKQPAAEAAASVADLDAETKDEKKQTLLTDDKEADIVMERLTLKEVSILVSHFIH